MHLRSVELINWRSYRHARFQFPRPHGRKNVILVMAPNEFGKTSFFEAITLGLFGRDGLSLVPRARAAAGHDAIDRLKASYSQFLSNTLHWQATASGPAECVVNIEMEDEDNEPIELKRTWHFRQDGTHKAGDDQLVIYEGITRTPVAPPANVEDRDGWYRDWIAQRFIHSSLAEFFLFDGEQVQRYASRGMSGQVRRGIEGLLGLPILHSLRDSLARYAQNRRTSAAAPSDSTVKSVEADIARIEEEIEKNQRVLDELDAVIPQLEAEVDDLTQRLGSKGEGTVALVSSLMEDEQRHLNEASRAVDALTNLIAGDVALGLAGVQLRKAALDRLEAEAKREGWEAGRNEGNQNLERFTSELSDRIGQLDLPLGVDDREAILDAARAAYASLWHPPPEGYAEDYLHTALMGAMRAQAIARLEAVDRHSGAEIAGHAERFNTAVATAESRKRERLDLEHTAPEIEEQTERLKERSEQLGKFKTQHEGARRIIDARESDLANRRAELGRHVSRIGASAPALRRARRADQFAALIGDLLKDAVPSEVSEVAAEMTKAWKSMAHMSDRIDRIEITPDCEVRMLTAEGLDVHPIDKSAGASQVFTQALITAITKVSGRNFPFVVDTPLARLSRTQRIGVLKTFTDRPGQVVLLSTDQEVVDEKLDAIRDRISAAFELKVTIDKGISVTTVHCLDWEQM